jgi:hypothetical protein
VKRPNPSHYLTPKEPSDDRASIVRITQQPRGGNSKQELHARNTGGEMVRPRGFEPLAYSFGDCRSIQLSYGRAYAEVIRFQASGSRPAILDRLTPFDFLSFAHRSPTCANRAGAVWIVKSFRSNPSSISCQVTGVETPA